MNSSTFYGPNTLDRLEDARAQGSIDSIDNVSSRVIRVEQWSPWKSFGKLVDEAILEMGWQERYSVLHDIIYEYGKEKKGHLTLNEFLEVLSDNPITDEQYRSVFYNLMDRNQDGIVSEVEFISGMLSLSPLAKNDPNTSIGQLRLQFIFLYYDIDRNGLLSLNELKRMIMHISSIRSLARKTKSLTESKAREYAIHLIAHYDGVFGFNGFFNSVKNNILKGTGWLLRTHLDLVDYILKYERINNGFISEKMFNSLPANERTAFNATELKQSYENPKLNEVSRFKKTHFFSKQRVIENKLNRNSGDLSGRNRMGCELKVMNIFPGNFQNGYYASLEQRVIDYYMNISVNTNNVSEFEEKLYINNVLNHLEIIDICDRAVEIIRNENSLISIHEKTSVRIFGGIHGQLIDLLHFFENFSWPHFQRGDILSMKYVFLGDYVDEGKFSLEVTFILFSLKIMFPDRIFLLRGNHEDPMINSSSGFLFECRNKYGSNGDLIWERINDAFEFLSICAVIDDQVMCLHSGIGKSIQRVEHLLDIPKPIHVKSDLVNGRNDITGNDRHVLDCIWSNLIEKQNFEGATFDDCIVETDTENNELNKMEFGVINFDSNDVENFINNNRIRLIVNTGDYCRGGCEYNVGGKVLSLTSATNYCNRYCNDAAVLVITQGPNEELIQYNQILKSESVDNSFGWMDQGTNKIDSEIDEYANFKVKPVVEQSYLKELPNRKISVGPTSGKESNSSNNFNRSVSPKSSTIIINTDEKPITPAKIMNLYGRPINLTAF
ncbi:Serine/threonine-protein phosphatase [Cryptosporidium felis]|nr:Serine/threonine-protein phosphatase [Cryptosporidium felis]